MKLEKSKIYALVDCNNFFASCETIFNPKLRGKAVVILSNNDGCIIARSKEAKALDIPMGIPVHKCKNIIEEHNVKMFSANFQLYGDISKRIMKTLATFTDSLEIYSIDEAFLDLSNAYFKEKVDLEKLAKSIQKKILQYTGVGVSVGISYTKTLAKLANHVGKKNDGVCVIVNQEDIDQALKITPVGEIWGIGWNFSAKLKQNGIYSAYDFARIDDRWAKKNMSVVGQRMVFELNGTPCISLDKNHNPRKMIMSSRSFGRKVRDIKELEEAVSTYAARATEKLRSQGSICQIVGVSVRTSKHAPFKYGYGEAYSAFQQITLPNPTSYLPEIAKAAIKCLRTIYKKGIDYKKASVFLMGITDSKNRQLDLFHIPDDFEKHAKVMAAFDQINNSYGQNKIIVASQGLKQNWLARRNYVSPRYTTKWEEIPYANT